MSSSNNDEESPTFLPAENDDAKATAAAPPHLKENTEVVYG
jgi:hypothetical protein